jgi:hypothetical protein
MNRIPLALRSFERPQDRSFETPQDRPASAGLSADFETARKNRASSVRTACGPCGPPEGERDLALQAS